MELIIVAAIVLFVLSAISALTIVPVTDEDKGLAEDVEYGFYDYNTRN